MTSHESERDAEALDAYLHAKLPADHPDLPRAEAELAAALKSAAQEIQPPAQFETELEQSLMREAQRKPAVLQRRLNTAGRTAVWVGLAAVLLLGLSWVFRTLLPGTTPASGPAESTSPVAVLPGITEPVSATATSSPGEPTPVNTSEAAPQTYNLPMLPEAQVVLQADLPVSQSESQLYLQKTWPVLTAEGALQIAQQLGVDGQLYQAPGGSSGATSILVSDGFARLIFQQAAPWYLYYAAGSASTTGSSALTAEQILAAGEDFLKTIGLDTFEYRAETQADSPGAALFVQTLEGSPVSYTPFDNPKMKVTLDDQGQAIQVESSLLDFEPLGSYPIISAHGHSTRRKPR